jgi:hypothetical protein
VLLTPTDKSVLAPAAARQQERVHLGIAGGNAHELGEIKLR